LPVHQFGLRVGVYTIGDVAIRENGYDPVKEIAIFVPCACDVDLHHKYFRSRENVTTQAAKEIPSH
jgi:hypothetical protein